jgi:hypothetical protein
VGDTTHDGCVSGEMTAEVMHIEVSGWLHGTVKHAMDELS